MIEVVRQKAKELLASGKVKCVVGYAAGRRGGRPVPFFARAAAEADSLVLDAFCRGGLANYARREAGKTAAAFVANRYDIRALKVLIQEKQLPAENVYIIGFSCDRPGEAAGKCEALAGERVTDFADLAVATDAERALDAEVEKLKNLNPAERWAYWRAQFDKCARCYACRSACSMCYCDECIAERNLPQWIETTAAPRGNLAWNLIRAWHLAGRCIGCGACERACPEGIRLMLLNRLLAGEVREAFMYAAGEGSVEEAAVFARFKDNDREDFILEK